MVLLFIEDGLTYVLQVCDNCANKEFETLIKKLYMKCRAKFIKDERAKMPNNPNRRIKINIQVTDTT